MFIKEANKVYLVYLKLKWTKTWICVGYGGGKEITSGLCNLLVPLVWVLQRNGTSRIDRLIGVKSKEIIVEIWRPISIPYFKQIKYIKI